jgi:hypothetical protein
LIKGKGGVAERRNGEGIPQKIGRRRGWRGHCRQTGGETELKINDKNGSIKNVHTKVNI